MPLAEKLLVAAFLCQVLWTFRVMRLTATARFKAAREKRITSDISIDSAGWPDDVRKITNNMNNQFETPTLFYALILLALVLHLSSLILVILAFVYVASRVVHTYIHTGYNKIMHRARTFFVGVGSLIAMTIVIILDLLTGSII